MKIVRQLKGIKSGRGYPLFIIESEKDAAIFADLGSYKAGCERLGIDWKDWKTNPPIIVGFINNEYVVTAYLDGKTKKIKEVRTIYLIGNVKKCGFPLYNFSGSNSCIFEGIDPKILGRHRPSEERSEIEKINTIEKELREKYKKLFLSSKEFVKLYLNKNKQMFRGEFRDNYLY